jgi:hypothetical protein
MNVRCSRKRVLVLGGGAPNLTLMSGALLALHGCSILVMNRDESFLSCTQIF